MWMLFLTRVFPFIVFMLSLYMGLVALHNDGVNKGRKQVEGEWAVAREVQLADQVQREKEARAKEQGLLDVVNMIEVEKNHEKTVANARYAAVVAQLRDRKEARATTTGGVPTTAGTESGCTGEGLAGPDGRFLARYAADAKQLAIGFEACMAAWDDSRAILNNHLQNAK